MGRIEGICIKSYQDEDSLEDFEEGRIEECEIKVYEVGDVGMIVEQYYDREHWKPLKCLDPTDKICKRYESCRYCENIK